MMMMYQKAIYVCFNNNNNINVCFLLQRSYSLKHFDIKYFILIQWYLIKWKLFNTNI